MAIAAPITFILMMWWFSTGAVLWFARQSDGESRLPMAIMAVIGAAGLIGTYQSAFGSDQQNDYLAVLSALSVWAFIEFTFLTAALTGSRREPCPRNVTEHQRFWLAFRAIDYHEYALVAALALIGLISLPGGYFTAFATFGLLWVMRISAKLTLFSGAPTFALDMMPPRLAYLQSYFRHDRVGPVFWASTLIFTAGFIAAIIALASGSIATKHETAAIMLTTLLGLGVLEHWFMVLPIADSALWRWAMPSSDEKNKNSHNTSMDRNDQPTLLIAPGYSAAGQNTRQMRRGAPS